MWVVVCCLRSVDVLLSAEGSVEGLLSREYQKRASSGFMWMTGRRRGEEGAG